MSPDIKSGKSLVFGSLGNLKRNMFKYVWRELPLYNGPVV